jgi:trehalose-6-phosphate synthase
LVIVSNRVALPGEGAQRSGGLVTGLVDALHQAGGLWFGWSGKLGETAPEPNVLETEGVTYATVDLTRADHDGYYSGFSNAALWPSFTVQEARFRPMATFTLSIGIYAPAPSRLVSILKPSPKWPVAL